jgi:hypothetical protein
VSHEKISQLDEVTDVQDDDLYVLARGSNNNSITGASLKAAFGGPSASFLWAKIVVSGTYNLTAGSPHYDFLEGDIAITDGNGLEADLTVGDFEGNSAVLSASGGIFQAGLFWGITGATLGASTETRAIKAGLAAGTDAPDDINGIGIDSMYYYGRTNLGSYTRTDISLPYYIASGEAALCYLDMHLYNGQGGDSFAGSGILTSIYLWKPLIAMTI